ncbi:hypothetical protein CP533_3154 [Ophiocordyceps camponoti-saundersi (nom. inval.)]|nr:hypothetical protein CP533_3154 [Ophiocordyceps camponoti-saundersi (nom. inval.)]
MSRTATITPIATPLWLATGHGGLPDESTSSQNAPASTPSKHENVDPRSLPPEEMYRFFQEQLMQKDQENAELKEKVEKLSLEDYLNAAHDNLYMALENIIVPRQTPSNKKPTHTNVDKKFCPFELKPWQDFRETQEGIFQDLFKEWKQSHGAFPCRTTLKDNGEQALRGRVADENDLDTFLHTNTEAPVQMIIGTLGESGAVKGRFNISHGIAFQNSLAGINLEPRREGVPSDSDSAPEVMLVRGIADRFCCHNSENFLQRLMVHVSEFKRPQDLTKDTIDRHLHPMNIYRDVCQKISTRSVKDVDFSAKEFMAAAIAQTYHYMVQSGVDYGLLSTGEAFIFLKIDWKGTPGTVYYHLSYPGKEAKESPKETSYQLTAIGQYLAFTLLAAGRPGTIMTHDQSERKKLIDELMTWGESSKEPPPESSFYDAKNNDDDDDDDDDGDDDNQTRRGRPTTRSQSAARRGGPQTGRRKSNSTQQTRRGSGQSNARKRGGSSQNDAMFESLGGPGSKCRGADEGDMPYCTQKCLAGIASGAPLDEKCPNVALHRGKNKKCSHHRLNQTQFLDHLSKQLRWSLDRGVTPLGVNGASGIMFKVTLLLYGYTMISKGTVEPLAPYLAQETAIYERLRPIQGKHVPVCLGSVDLRTIGRTYYYPFGMDVMFMIFFAWGGIAADRAKLDGERMKAFEEKADQSLRACHDLGVIHDDVRLPNMLVSEEGDNVFMIDFERATVVEPRRKPRQGPHREPLRKTLTDKTNRQPRVPPSPPSGSGSSPTSKKHSQKAQKEPRKEPRQEPLRKTLVDKTNRQPQVQPSSSRRSRVPPSPTSKKRDPIAVKAETRQETIQQPRRTTLVHKTNHQPQMQCLPMRQARAQPSQSSGSGSSITTKKRSRNAETEPTETARAKRLRLRQESPREPRREPRRKTVAERTDRQTRSHSQSSGSGPPLTRKRTRNAEPEPSQSLRSKKIHLCSGSWAFNDEARESESRMRKASRMRIT